MEILQKAGGVTILTTTGSETHNAAGHLVIRGLSVHTEHDVRALSNKVGTTLVIIDHDVAIVGLCGAMPTNPMTGVSLGEKPVGSLSI